jgi:hypothetical protein
MHVQVERYDDSDSFFEQFEHDTFEREEELRMDGAVVGWLGYVDGNVCAGYDFAGNWGWTTL